MKLIIAGSRHIEFGHHGMDDLIRLTLGEKFVEIDEIVSGCARGIDTCGEEVAQIYDIKVAKFPADWELYGKRAGHIRNAKMAIYGDILLLIWDGESRGSANMKENMEKLNKPIYEIIIKKIVKNHKNVV